MTPADICMVCAECHAELPANDFTRNHDGEPCHWECAEDKGRRLAGAMMGDDA